MMRVLYDGWALVYQPEHPAALHLLALLENLPVEVEPVVVLPSQPPAWLPSSAQAYIFPTRAGLPNRLRWEQLTLPQIFGRVQADLFHLTSPNPPLFGLSRMIVSPAGYGDLDHHEGFLGRLRRALSAGGMVRARALAWPADLPCLQAEQEVFFLPPLMPAIFQSKDANTLPPEAGLDLPETFVLYHGPQSETDLRRLLQAWTWAAGPIGEYYPLLLVGLGKSGRLLLAELCAEYGVSETVRALKQVSPDQLARIYRGCSALFHPCPESPWGGSVRCALACGKPIVAYESPLMDALIGPAGYLVPPGLARPLGAALITVIVEQVISEQLAQAALRRAASWDKSGFGPALLTAYQSVIYSP
ncbi:MAG TPA: glycosyltransferase [Anaerolineales bacterium]|nr:glycosyltransferase [Anaerolineales bacterium]